MKKFFDCIRVPEEKSLLSFFEDTFNLRTVNDLISFKENEAPDNYLPFYMRGYYLPINDSFGGEINKICQHARQKLGFKKNEIEFYVANDAEFNSSSILSTSKNRPHIVIINRGLLDRVNIDELAFVMGHEIGHLIYQHSYASRVIQFVYPEYENMPPFLQKLYDVWSKLGEISADRIGLLVCQKIETAVRALFKLSSGLDDRSFQVSFDNLVKISEDTFYEMAQNPSYVSASHPANPIRIKALTEFYNSKMGKSIMKGKICAADAPLEEKINEILMLIRKIPFNEEEELSLALLASAGMKIMLSEPRPSDEEYDYLLNVLSDFIHWPPAYLDQLNPDNLEEVLKTSSKTLVEKYPQRVRDLLRNLCPSIVRDKKLKNGEVTTFMSIATDDLKIPVSEVVELFLDGLRELFKPGY